MEELPLYVPEGHDGLWFLSNDEDEVTVGEIAFTKYVPGARWLYWKYRDEYLKIFRISYFLLWFGEIFCVAYKLSQEVFEFFYLSSLLAGSLSYFIFSDLIVCQKFVVDTLSEKVHILSLGIIIAIFIRIEVISNLVLVFCSSSFFLNDSELIVGYFPASFFYHLFMLRVSIVFDFSLFGVLGFLVEYFQLRREVILVVIELIILGTQSVHISFSHLSFLSYIYFRISDDFIEKSLIVTLSTTIVLIFFKYTAK
jgi:hypothetical protein